MGDQLSTMTANIKLDRFAKYVSELRRTTQNIQGTVEVPEIQPAISGAHHTLYPLPSTVQRWSPLDRENANPRAPSCFK